MKDYWQLVLEVTYFVNKSEAMFFTKWLKISNCTWIKLLLDVASSVKATVDSKFYILGSFSGQSTLSSYAPLTPTKQVQLN